MLLGQFGTHYLPKFLTYSYGTVSFIW